MIRKQKKKSGQVISLDFGSHSIKCVVGQHQNDKIRISNMFSIPLNEELFSNGYLINQIQVKSLILEQLKDRKIKTKDVVISVESTEIIKRELTIPNVQEEDRLDLITYEIGQYLPIDLDAYIIQYKVIAESTDAIGNILITKVGAMPKMMAEQYYNLLMDCGLTPKALDLHSHSLEKFVKWNYRNTRNFENETAAFIDFGHSFLNITLFDKKKVVFDRLVNMGGREFDRILMNQLNLDAITAEKKKIGVDIHQAFEALEAAREDVMHSERPEPRNIILFNTAFHLDECLEELNKVLKYYTSRHENNRIDGLYFYGGSSQFINLEKYIEDKLELKTEMVVPYGKIEYVAKEHDEAFAKYIHAIGSLL